jgi:hypothetical protein
MDLSTFINGVRKQQLDVDGTYLTDEEVIRCMRITYEQLKSGKIRSFAEEAQRVREQDERKRRERDKQ